MANSVSVVMIVKDGAKTIAQSLDSLKAFEDVVVYDNGSSDGTQEIVKGYNNVNLIEGEFIGFGDTKNKAAGYAVNDWILILDSDEVVEQELADTLLTENFDETQIYRINFKAFYRQRQIKYSGWNNQKIRRFYHRLHSQFNSNWVHENLINDAMRIQDLHSPGSIQHYSYHDISDFIVKVDRYSSLFAENNAGKKYSSPAKAIVNAGYSFFRTYVLKRGFMDGYPGLVIAFSHMATNFYKYIKLYEKNKEVE
jgi:glycosyltransferase involved in cell wall biosynthesis